MPILQPVVRRSLLDLVLDTGGEQNDEVLAILLAELGHRVARSDVGAELRWLAEQGLVKLETVGSYLVARSTSDGRDVAAGCLIRDGVSRHKTGE